MRSEDASAIREVLLEEYRTLRQESLDTMGDRLTVVNFTFAALSVVIGAMIASESVSPVLLALFGIVVVPQGAKAGLFIWLGEYQRSQRAGRHIQRLEERINDLVGANRGEGLTWESGLVSRSIHMSTPYIATVIFTVGMGWAGALLGVWYAGVALGENLAGGTLVLAIAGLVAAIGLWETVALRRFLTEWRAARRGIE